MTNCSSTSRCRRARTSGSGCRRSAAHALARAAVRQPRAAQGRLPRSLGRAPSRDALAGHPRRRPSGLVAAPARRWRSCSRWRSASAPARRCSACFTPCCLQPLPLCRPGSARPAAGAGAPRASGERLFSAPEVRDLRARCRASTASPSFTSCTSSCSTASSRSASRRASSPSNFFDVIGVDAGARPRPSPPSEEQPGAPGVIVLSHRFWQQQLGGDPRVIGRVFQMNDRAHTRRRRAAAAAGLSGGGRHLPADRRLSAAHERAGRPGPHDASGERARSCLASRTRRRSDDACSADLDAPCRAHSAQSRRHSTPSPPALSVVPVHDDLTGRFRPTLSVLVASTTFLLLSLCSSVGAPDGREHAAAARERCADDRARRLARTAVPAVRHRGAAARRQSARVAGMLLWRHQTVPVLACLAAGSRRAPATSISTGVTLVCRRRDGGRQPAHRRDRDRHRVFVADRHRHARASAPRVHRPRPLQALVVLHIAVSFALLVGAGLMLRSLAESASGWTPAIRRGRADDAGIGRFHPVSRTARGTGDLFQHLQSAVEPFPG